MRTNGTRLLLEVHNLPVSVEGNEIFKGLDLAVNVGEVHAFMGPNGSGKSTPRERHSIRLSHCLNQFE